MTKEEHCEVITREWRNMLDCMRRIGDNLGADEELVLNLDYVRGQLERVITLATYARDHAEELGVDIHNYHAQEVADVR